MIKGDRKKISRRVKYEKPWTFITHHAAVLSILSMHPCVTAREIAQEVGITERSVWIIINDLDRGGYIRKIREGRNMRYIVDSKQFMRHRTKKNIAVRDLLSVLNTNRSSLDRDPIP
jgi:predicted transcriptional regulator